MGYGLLGEHLAHSYSPQIHAAFGNPDYRLYEKAPEEVADFLKTGDFEGLNVTIPYKKTVMPFCAKLSPAARAIGSVNTLVRRPDGTLFGDNTDADGFRAMVASLKIDPRGRKALVFGSGGASLTACYVLRELGAKVITVSRSGPDNYENIGRHADAEILVNTTPLGMYPHTGRAAVAVKDFPRCGAVLDVVYNPARTQLVLEAEALGLPCRDGLLMLVTQAAEAIRRWQPEKVLARSNLEVMRELRARMSNLVLIGMPGCGKSTIGQLLAKELNRPLVDADMEVEKQTGLTIPEIFARYGEEGFRREETAVLRRIGQESGLVIATGGGCVTRAENYNFLHQNGTILYLKRDLAALPTEGRPLSRQNDLAAMYEKRRPLYEQFADAAVENNAAPEETAARAKEVFYEITGY